MWLEERSLMTSEVKKKSDLFHFVKDYEEKRAPSE